MVRNWDIIREILLQLESAQTANARLNASAVSMYPEQEVAYNMRLLHEAGYIEANILNSSRGDGSIAAALARRMTNAGHDLLETIRTESIWGKVKETFKSKGVEMTFDLILSVGKEVTKGVLLS